MTRTGGQWWEGSCISKNRRVGDIEIECCGQNKHGCGRRGSGYFGQKVTGMNNATGVLKTEDCNVLVLY